MIHDARQIGITLEQRRVKIDFKNEKRYKEMIDEYFVKPVKKEEEEKEADDVYDSLTRESNRKTPEILQIEDEYNALLQNKLVLRRGRQGRLFTKYI